MNEFDENFANQRMDLYSRQIGAFGVETMRHFTEMNILIVGLQGIGVEVAKNLILAGPKAVDIFDDTPTHVVDMGTNFYLNESLINISRAKACLNKLEELNPYVDVAEINYVDENIFLNYRALIVTSAEIKISILKKWSDFCHSNGIIFILATTLGLTASIFTDFGPSHIISDATGEPKTVNVIEDIIYFPHEEKGFNVIISVAAAQHSFSDGDKVIIEGVLGIPELAEPRTIFVYRHYKTLVDGTTRKSRQILIKRELRFFLEKISGKYQSGGMITEVKNKIVKSYVSLSESLSNPKNLIHPHAEKMLKNDQANQLHLARCAIWRFQEVHNRLPGLHDRSDASWVCLEAEKINNELGLTKNVDHRVFRQTALFARTELPGLTAFIGGIAAQEVIKIFGKWIPLDQWLYIDYFELLSGSSDPDGIPQDAQQFEPNRYSNQIAIFGNEFQKNLSNEKWFLVGCGALGCEYLKGFSLMGLGTGPEGHIYVTDMDRIEVSNLSRQFLFRKKDVGQPKSKIATKSTLEMNPDMQITFFEIPVASNTEDVFGDKFWKPLTGVCNALDNIKARRYVDSRCVFFEKPLLESGTLGTKANSEVIIPHKTASYSESKDFEESTSIPMCTLRLFPNLIEHCIEWSRSKFSDIYDTPVKDLNILLTNPVEFFNTINAEKNSESQINRLKAVVSLVSEGSRLDYSGCIRLAFNDLVNSFYQNILQLITYLPIDAKKKDPITGEEFPFWTGAKRFPRVLDYSLDGLSLDYLFASSNIYASVFGIEMQNNKQAFRELVQSLNLQLPTKCDSSRSINLEDEPSDVVQNSISAEQEEKMQQQEISNLKTQLESHLKSIKFRFKANCIEFEKDDDSNYHIDFLTSCTNLRAYNYRIEPASRHKVKMIAGRIVPAIATTTAMITGLIELEIYKLQLKLNIDNYCCSNINLGLSSFQLFEPSPPIFAKKRFDIIALGEVVPVPEKFTIWDKIIVDLGYDATPLQFVEAFPKIHYGVQVECLLPAKETDKPYVLFNLHCYTPEQKRLAVVNNNKPISKLYEELYGPIQSDGYLLLTGNFLTSNGDEADIPIIKYIFKHDNNNNNNNRT